MIHVGTQHVSTHSHVGVGRNGTWEPTNSTMGLQSLLLAVAGAWGELGAERDPRYALTSKICQAFLRIQDCRVSWGPARSQPT